MPLAPTPRPCSSTLPSRRRWLVLCVSLLLSLSAFPFGPAQPAAAGPTVPAWPAVATDTFNRTTTGGWGPAEVGGLYTVDYSGRPPADHFSVVPGKGLIDLQPGLAATASLSAVAASDIELRTTFDLPTVGGVYYSEELRRRSNGDAYRVQVKTMNSGAIVLAIVRRASGTDTALTQFVLPFRIVANQSVILQAQAVGANPVAISAKAWLEGASEPAWQATVQDSASDRLSSAGTVGLWVYLSSSAPPTRVQVASLKAWAPITPPATSTLNTSPATTTSTASPTTSTPTPTSTTTAQTTTTSPAGTTAARGSVPVGSAAYPIPAGAVYVDGANGRDSAAGGLTSPVKSVGAAIAKAPSGGTVVVRAGIYNESLLVTKTLTIQAYPKEAVWFDGSVPVSNWVQTGNRWVSSGWTVVPDNSLGGGDSYSRFVDPAYPMANEPDQVFYDGSNLTQVTNASAVGPGTFSIDHAAKTITLGNNPNGHEVRASNLGQAFYVTSTGSTLQGFGVRRYGTPYLLSGAVRMGNANSTVRDLVVQDNATIGVMMRNSNDRAERLTSTRNGMLGLGATTADGLTIVDSVLTENNTERFKPAPVAGGLKVTRSRNLTVSNVDASRNYATGLWFDESSVGITVVNSTADANKKHGIELELCERGIIANNSATGNGDTGVLIFDTGTVRVYNNSIGGNTLFGLQLKQDQRRQADASFAGHDPRQPVPDPTNPWLTRNITVSNNAFGNGGYFQFYGLDGKTGIGVDSMNVTITGNLFNNRAAKTDPTMVGWGGTDNATVTRYETPAALAAAKNSTWLNRLTATSVTIGRMSADIQQAQDVAIALPADIAAAVGVPAGTRRLGPLS